VLPATQKAQQIFLQNEGLHRRKFLNSIFKSKLKFSSMLIFINKFFPDKYFTLILVPMTLLSTSSSSGSNPDFLNLKKHV
jgi:hypothetical protein